MRSAVLQFLNCRFRFLARTPKKQPTFLTSDDKQDDASYATVFRSIQKWSKLTKKLISWLILHPMRHTPRFCQTKDLIKIYICGKFHQYRYVVVKLKIFCCIDSVSMIWPLFAIFGPLLPQILFDLAGTLTIGSLL